MKTELSMRKMVRKNTPLSKSGGDAGSKNATLSLVANRDKKVHL